MGDVIEKYRVEILPTLKHSTQDTNASMLNVQVEPKWGHVKLARIEAYDVDQ
jgi:hypothetical protein